MRQHYFNPRSPHRERQPTATMTISPNLLFQSTLPSQGATADVCGELGKYEFQSTLPSQGATISAFTVSGSVFISIHAPLTGSDYSSLLLRTALVHFNPRSPHRERLFSATLSLVTTDHFNPRSPHRERPPMRRRQAYLR